MAGTWVALLRGINVGKAKRVAMADLRSTLEGLGYSSVRTLLASGNVVFDSQRALPKDAAVRMQEALVEATGVSSRFIVLPAGEFAGVVQDNPLAARIAEPSRGFVTFVQPGVSLAAVQAMRKQSWGRDEVALGGRVIYTWCPDGLLESKLMEAIGKAMRDDITVRNWATTLKIQDLATG